MQKSKTTKVAKTPSVTTSDVGYPAARIGSRRPEWNKCRIIDAEAPMRPLAGKKKEFPNVKKTVDTGLDGPAGASARRPVVDKNRKFHARCFSPSIHHEHVCHPEAELKKRSRSGSKERGPSNKSPPAARPGPIVRPKKTKPLVETVVSPTAGPGTATESNPVAEPAVKKQKKPKKPTAPKEAGLPSPSNGPKRRSRMPSIDSPKSPKEAQRSGSPSKPKGSVPPKRSSSQQSLKAAGNGPEKRAKSANRKKRQSSPASKTTSMTGAIKQPAAKTTSKKGLPAKSGPKKETAVKKQ